MDRLRWRAVLVAFVLILTPLPAAAASLGLDITGGPEGGIDPVNSFTIGWGVAVITPVRVTALGVWDEELDGLLVSHAVGLWTATGTLIASTSVPAGTAADTTVASTSGVGRWLFEDIADVVLQPGNYVLGSTSDGDDFRAVQNGVILDPNLATFDGSRFHFGANLEFPEQNLDGIGFFGPNFLLEPVPVTPTPLPASLALVGLGLLGWGVGRTIRRASR